MAAKTFLLLIPVMLMNVCILEGMLHVRAQRISFADLAALREIKNSLTDIAPSSPTSFFASWDFTARDPCSSFSGVTCSSSNPKKVTSLTLGTGLSDSPGLAGTLSTSISNLSELTQLVLFAGIVTGPIPPQLGSLKKLGVISLTNNRLTGTIPASLFTLPNLHTLDLSHNQLSGTVPGSISELTQLRVLILGTNRFTGEIPALLPSQLLHLDLSNNELSGTFPKRMPLTIRYMSVSRNRLWGPLNALESLSELVYLDLSMNKLSGPIPSTLFRNTLPSMFLQRNYLNGRIQPPTATDTAEYGAGSTVDLSHNSLTGDVPSILSGVETLFLNNNRFTGTVPKEYVESVYSGNTRTLYLQHNYITEFPLDTGLALPDSVALCLSYNCMVPPVPVGFMACPASSGEQLSRPAYQCSGIN